MLKGKKTWKILIAVILVIALGVIGFKIFGPKAPEGFMVTEGEVSNKDLSQKIVLQGELRSKNRSEIIADLSETINDIRVKEGDTVKKGDILAVLDSRSINNDINTARMALSMSEATIKEKMGQDVIYNLQKDIEARNLDLQDAQRKFDTTKALFESGGETKENYDNAELSLKRAKIALDQSKQKLSDAKTLKDSDKKSIESQKTALNNKISDLEKTILRSPIDGTVTRVSAKVGTSAKSVSGPLFVVEDLENMEVKIKVGDFDIGKVKLGQKAIIKTQSMEDRTVEGVVSNIYPTAESKDGNATGKEMIVPVIIDVHGKDPQLITGLPVETTIQTAAKKGVLSIPYEAIYEKPDKTKVVFKIEKNHTLKEIPVQTGLQGELDVEVIAKDLKAKDKLALYPNETFVNGMKVVSNPGMAGAMAPAN